MTSVVLEKELADKVKYVKASFQSTSGVLPILFINANPANSPPVYLH